MNRPCCRKFQPLPRRAIRRTAPAPHALGETGAAPLFHGSTQRHIHRSCHQFVAQLSPNRWINPCGRARAGPPLREAPVSPAGKRPRALRWSLQGGSTLPMERALDRHPFALHRRLPARAGERAVRGLPAHRTGDRRLAVCLERRAPGGGPTAAAATAGGRSHEPGRQQAPPPAPRRGERRRLSPPGPRRCRRPAVAQPSHLHPTLAPWPAVPMSCKSSRRLRAGRSGHA
jgi:hypothetical protein